jgi:hypothetical protein
MVYIATIPLSTLEVAPTEASREFVHRAVRKASSLSVGTAILVLRSMFS